jgi:hypothetical protein
MHLMHVVLEILYRQLYDKTSSKELEYSIFSKKDSSTDVVLDVFLNSY